MRYEPGILFNPTNEEKEFMYGGVVYVFKPGEKRMVNKEVVTHVRKKVNTEIREYNPETDDEAVEASDVDYEKMRYGQLKSLAIEKGLWSIGMNKKDIIEALIKADE